MISKIRCEAIYNAINDTIQDFIMEREDVGSISPQLEKELIGLRDDIWNNVNNFLPRHND